MVTPDDDQMMARALFLAERGRGRTSPNPMVGAVVVSPSGVVVGHGAHLRAGGPHAEVVALDEAGAQARGATLYSTLEPCSHHGRTGPCAERVVRAGIARVVVAVGDPNPKVAGAGLAYLRAHGVDVIEGVRRDDARRLNAPFFVWVTERRPFVVAKFAASADGFVGLRERRVKLTGPRADQYFQQQRAEVDAIAVGSGTVLTDDPLLTARQAWRGRPLTRVVCDWRARVPATARVFSTLGAGPVIMVVSARAAASQPRPLAELEARGVTVRRESDRRLRPLFEWLAARDVVSLLVEGGPTLQTACRDEALIDRVQCAFTPHVLGHGVPAPQLTGAGAIATDGAFVRVLDLDRVVEVDVHRPH